MTHVTVKNTLGLLRRVGFFLLAGGHFLKNPISDPWSSLLKKSISFNKANFTVRSLCSPYYDNSLNLHIITSSTCSEKYEEKRVSFKSYAV